MVLDYKQIEYKLIDADLHYGTEDYLKVTPFGRVPSMIVDGVLINESMVMVEYLEENYSNHPLFSDNSLEKAKIRLVCEIVNSTIHPIQNSNVVKFFKPDLDKKSISEIRAKWIGRNLNILANYLWTQSQFVVGRGFTMADIFVSVIYNKGVQLGMQRTGFLRFEKHLNYLMDIAPIRDSCPIRPQQQH